MSVLATVAAAHRSGSIYIANASLVAALVWVGSMLLWPFPEVGVWRYAVLELLALVYFYRRWSSPEAQHRQFHFLLMCFYLIASSFYAYQQAVSALAPGTFAMSGWWYQLIDNILFECGLALIFGYALAFRRAKADTAKWRSDVNGWFAKAGDFRRGAVAFLRRTMSRTDKPGSGE